MNRAEYMRGYRQRMGVTDKRNTCVVCGSSFTARRGAKTCSPGCRQKSYREHVTDVGPVRAKPKEDKTMTESNSMTKSERTELPRNPMSIDIFDIPPHPAADAFPMMEEEELEELAADIKAHGLLMPLFVGHLDGKTVLVDGRNRREACRRAGVVPNHTVLSDWEDPINYILSANIARRHLNKGQRAMAVAKIWSVSDQTSRQISDQTKVSKTRLISASVVLKHAPDLASQVLLGHISLDNAYGEARIRKGRAETYEARFNALKAAAPDLAEMVTESQLNLEEAEAAYRERQERIHRNKVLLAQALHDLARHAYLLDPPHHDEILNLVAHEAELYKERNFGSIDEVLHALEVFAEHAGPLLARINELKAEKSHVEES
jgi:ParB/RepB/Spo0J family partition protein